MAERGRGRAEVWRPWRGRAPAFPWPAGLAGFGPNAARLLREWLVAEVAAGRLFPWLPIAFGLGIVLYFAAEREPLTVAPPILFGVLAAGAFLARRRPIAFPAMLMLATIAGGFAAASLKRAIVEHPVLSAAAWNVEIAGYVEKREERERSDRIIVRVHKISSPRLDAKVERVRLSVRKGTAPPVASYVELRARLTPPLQPLRPGGYDYARDMYFHGIGASGFALGRIRTVETQEAPGLWLRYTAIISSLRDGIDARIRAVLPGDRGAIASALITGKRDTISSPVNDAMYVSSLAHVLSISGYHMAIVAGVVFFVLRALLALWPAAAARHPIKKWSALAALAAAAFYLLLSGAEVATQRSFIMVAIVLVGVMSDRAALTLRTLAVAAFAVLLLAPEAVVHPSFQMSFAATLVLVTAYHRGLAWTTAGADTSLGARAALWGAREALMLVTASLLAGLATAPFAAYHFHRIAPYGVIANLLAMPIVSIWVMPIGIAGVVALPLGFDGLFWRLMGEGIGWMIAVAQWVASLPGAIGRVPAFGSGPLLLGSLGLVVVCLLRTPLRLAGVAMIMAGCVWAVQTEQPDIMVAADGTTYAVRRADGRLAVIKTGSDSFAMRDWLSADGDARAPADKSLAEGIACDDAGCIGRLGDGRLVALAKSVEAFDEDCRRAAVVASQRIAPRECAALLIDRKVLQRSGAMSLRRDGDGFLTTAARPDGYDRPWARAPRPAEDADGTATSRRRPQPRDATPNTEDLEAD